MLKTFDSMYENIGVLLFIIMAVITALALIRVLLKARKGKAIDIKPVGVFNDLPESVTGIRKNKEWVMEEETEDKIDQ